MLSVLNSISSRLSSSASFFTRSFYRHTKPVFHHALLGILIFQFAFPQAASFAGPEDEQPKQEAGSGDVPPAAGDLQYAGTGAPVEFGTNLSDQQRQFLSGRMREQSEFFNRLAATPYDQYRMEPGKAVFNGLQTREDYVAVGDEDRVLATYSLTRDADVERPKIDFFPKELRIHYDPVTKRLEFQKWVFDKGLNRSKKLSAHIIHDVELSGSQKDSIVQDPNVLLISTKNWGVIGGFRPIAINALFNGFIPFTVWYPPASVVDSGAVIEKMQMLTPEDKPRVLIDGQGAEVNKMAIYGLVFSIRSGEKVESVYFDYRKDLLRRLKVHLISALLLLQASNPNAEVLPKLMQIIRKFTSSENNGELEKQAIDAVVNSPDNLSLAALRSTAHLLDLKALSGLVAEDENAKTATERLAEKDAFEWTAANWEELHNIIQASRKIEDEAAAELGVPVEKVRQSWGAILAAHFESDKPAADRIRKIAEQKAKAGNTFFGELISLAKDQLTPTRLTVLGACVVGDLANRFTGGKVTQALFSVVSNMLGWTTEVWGLNALVEETVKYANNYHQPFAFTSVALLLGIVLTFQPLTYVMAKTLALIKGDKNEDGTQWSAAQAFFSYGGRLYAHLSYPFQLWIWNLLGQFNLAKAYENGGGVSTPGAFHFPYSSRSAKLAEARMTQSFADEAIRKERAMLIAALAVSQVLKARGAPVDPATLIMTMQAHEAGKLTEFSKMLSELPPDADWNRIAKSVFGQLVKMKDGGLGPVDTESVNAYAQVAYKAIQQFGAMNAPRQGIVGCVKGAASDACRWVADKGRSFATWTGSLAATIIAGGEGYRFYKKNKNFVASPADARIADHQYRHDYFGSEVMTAAVDSQRFPVALQVNAHLDKVLATLADAGEQCGIYGAQGGVEQSMLSGINSNLVNPFPTLARTLNRREHLPHEDGYGAQAKVLESMGVIGTALGETGGDPRNPKAGIAGIFHTQITRMEATTRALQGKGLMGYVPRTIALVLISLVAAAQSEKGIGSWGGQTVLNDAGSALMRQANVIFSKLAIGYSGGSLIVGYAVIWALVGWAQNTLDAKADANRAQLEHVDHLIEQGIRNDEEVAWRNGVLGMQTLYDIGGKVLPDKFRVPASDYTLELAVELAKYSQQNPPVSTAISNKASIFNNIALGGFISTVLGVALSHNMYDKSLPIVPQLLAAVTAFAATYFGVKALRFATPKVVHGAKSVGTYLYNCAAALAGGQKPAQ